jgi:hypothetical protein
VHAAGWALELTRRVRAQGADNPSSVNRPSLTAAKKTKTTDRELALATDLLPEMQLTTGLIFGRQQAQTKSGKGLGEGNGTNQASRPAIHERRSGR